MSIFDEKWVADANGEVWLDTYGMYGLRASCPDPKDGFPVGTARAIAVLPEALALLKAMREDAGDSDSTALSPMHDEMCTDVLKRAGVLP